MTGYDIASRTVTGKGYSPQFLIYILLLMWKKRIKICQGGWWKQEREQMRRMMLPYPQPMNNAHFWYLVDVKEEDTQKTQKSKVSRTVEKWNQTWNRTELLRFVSGKMVETYGAEKTGPFSSYSLPSSIEGLHSSLFPPSLQQLWCFSCFLVIWVKSLCKLKTEPARREVSSFSWLSELSSSQWADNNHC